MYGYIVTVRFDELANRKLTLTLQFASMSNMVVLLVLIGMRTSDTGIQVNLILITFSVRIRSIDNEKMH